MYHTYRTNLYLAVPKTKNLRILRALRRTLLYNNGPMLQHKKGLTFEVIFNEIKFWNSIQSPLFIILCTMLSAGDFF